MRHSFTALLVAMTVSAIAPAAMAQAPATSSPMPHHKAPHSGARADMWKYLNLSADQKQKMQDLHKQDMPKMEAAGKAVHAEMKLMMDLYASPSVDDARMRAEYDKLQSAMNDAMSTHFNHMLSMRAILTPEQRKKFVAHMRQDHMGMGMGMGMGPMGHGGMHQ